MQPRIRWLLQCFWINLTRVVGYVAQQVTESPSHHTQPPLTTSTAVQCLRGRQPKPKLSTTHASGCLLSRHMHAYVGVSGCGCKMIIMMQGAHGCWLSQPPCASTTTWLQQQAPSIGSIKTDSTLPPTPASTLSPIPPQQKHTVNIVQWRYFKSCQHKLINA